MNKYKTGDKFVIELEKILIDGYDTVYKIKGTQTLYVNECQLDKLSKYNETEIKP